tara:strand:+ start:660 stop:1379 length:720 start_codon:yes stop_codon:yes gene_type:complete
MLRPAELASLLIDTATAISRVDFNNASNRQAYMKLERTVTENLPLQVKKFMVRNIDKTPFDNEQVNIEGDMFSIQELVGSLQQGGPVKQNSMGILQMQEGAMPQQQTVQAPLVEVDDPNAPRDSNGASEDTVPMTVREGDFVLNSLVRVTEGLPDIRKMIEEGLKAASKAGVNVFSTVDPSKFSDQTNLVDVIVGDGEIVIPKELIPFIGLDKLVKMNNRGLDLMKAIEAATKQKQEQG